MYFKRLSLVEQFVSSVESPEQMKNVSTQDDNHNRVIVNFKYREEKVSNKTKNTAITVIANQTFRKIGYVILI